ncbi:MULTISPECIES: hypothetical protein [Streptomyces]|uniref:hypothetical protein n=1 Tax=Streptomyces TaxID=1883 RepID=UPI000F558ECC|nr:MULTISPECIES: hypothetical protein [unclassified Streptomyces]RPK90859.1 hypothetical protein EES47_07435 [Streptomyces sp. ADI98-12]WPR51762.1 hypothetical protein SJI45_12625 [Streptomyces sp. S399]
MPGMNVAPDGDGSRARGDCRACEEFRLAEAVARAEHDLSRATDCRVLLRRHRSTAECADRGPA